MQYAFWVRRWSPTSIARVGRLFWCWKSGQRGRPVTYDQYWQLLMERHGRQHGTRAMIELLQFGSRHGYDRSSYWISAR
jgi:hypothetical protein